MFFPLPSGNTAYPKAGYMDYQPLDAGIIKFYNENCKHDLSQMGNSEYIGSEYLSDDYYYDFNMMWLIKSIERISITKDLDDDNVANGTEVGDYEMIMKISNNAFNAIGDVVQKRRIPIIGKSILCLPETGITSFLDRVYVFTPTVYDEKGNIATLKK